ncbi:MAG TPA: hypothetical protein VFJ02_12750 [Vicinamibacterales bacterium]|nr:hypothetical protein [Vicinamibacterales bacterium]
MATHVEFTDSPSVATFQQRALIVGLIGLAAGVAGAAMNFDQFVRSWLIGFLFCLGLSLGSMALLMLQHLSGGQWGLVSRRVFEAATRNLPVVALFFIPVLLRLPVIFEWAGPEAAENQIIHAKAGYLNVRFFIIRAVIYFAFWLICMLLLNRWSAEQDRGQGTTRADSVRFRKVSAPGLLFLVITVTFASVDWVMSLDPEWFSTIFGLLTISGWGLTALALTVVVLSKVDRDNVLGGVLKPLHFHDLGKLLLAFTMLWAYLSFSQFLIIWAGNLPEEIPWYVRRTTGNWGYVAIALVLGHFALPFILLLSQDLKKRSRLLARVAMFIILMRLVDLIWLVAPEFRSGAVFPIHWMDVAVPVGLTGIWMFLFARNLRSRAMLPVNDPYFREAFAHEHH